MKAEDFDIEFAVKLRELVAKYEIQYIPELFVIDDKMADAVFNAGVELLADTGLYHLDTQRVVKFTKEEILQLAQERKENPGKAEFGSGNDKMTMLRYYRIMKETFERTTYWELSPHNDLVSYGNLCLAKESEEYLIYTRVQHCRLQLPAHLRYSVVMINPLTGEMTSLPDADSDVDNNAWQYRKNLEGNWIFILKRK